MADVIKNPGGRPRKYDVKRVGILTRFSPSEVAQIDQARGDISRQDYVFALIMSAVASVGR